MYDCLYVCKYTCVYVVVGSGRVRIYVYQGGMIRKSEDIRVSRYDQEDKRVSRWYDQEE